MEKCGGALRSFGGGKHRVEERGTRGEVLNAVTKLAAGQVESGLR